MKHILLAIAASICAAPILSAGPGDSPLGGGLMDDFITPYDDTVIELPGEKNRKPSVSRSAQLVDDSTRDSWGTRDEDDSSSSSKTSSAKSSSSKTSSTKPSSSKNTSSSKPSTTKTSTSSGGSRSTSSGGSRSFTADGAYIPYSERYPEPEKEKKEGEFDRNTFDPNFQPFKNNYKYGDTNYQPNGTRPEFEETRKKIKDILGEGVPKVMTDSKVEELIHNPARNATLEAPTTPNRWVHAPNGWFCDYDDAMEKAQVSGKAVAVFFHSSDNDNSRKFKTERMENTKFKNKMRDRLLIVYMDYPNNAGTNKDKRNKDQVEHNSRIADKFHVSAYPTVVILNSSGSEIGRITDSSKDLTSFIDNADRIVPQKGANGKNQNSNGSKTGDSNGPGNFGGFGGMSPGDFGGFGGMPPGDFGFRQPGN